MTTDKMLQRMIEEPSFGYEGLSKSDMIWCFRNSSSSQKMWIMGYLLGGYVASGSDNWKSLLMAIDKESGSELTEIKAGLDKELIEIKRRNILNKGHVEVYYDYKDRPAYLYGSEESGWIFRFHGYADRELLTEIISSKDNVIPVAESGGYIRKDETNAEAKPEE